MQPQKYKLVALLVLAAALVAGVATGTDNAVPMAISFDRPLPDTEIVQLLRMYGAEPYAVYMTTGSLSGVHRTALENASEDLLQEARERSAHGADEAYQSSVEDLEVFLSETPRERFLASADLQAQGKSRLRNREEDRILRESARSEAPLVYALEVLVQPSKASALAADPLVKQSSVGTLVKSRAVVNRPKAPTLRRPAAHLEKLTPAALYDEIKRVATVDREEHPRAF